VQNRSDVDASPHADAHGCHVINYLIDIALGSETPPCRLVRTLATGVMTLSISGDPIDDREHLVVIQELAQGDPLSSFVLPSEAPMTTNQAMISHSSAYRMFADVADTVGWMHGHDVAHGDLKPSNLMVKINKQRLQTTIIDYSTVDFLEPGARRSQVGTPIYRPMGRSLRGQCTPREADQFAMAVMVLQAFTGHANGGLADNEVLAMRDADRLPQPLREATKALLRGTGDLHDYASRLRTVAGAARTVEMEMARGG
jgi:serine/threonine protein kinase